MPWLNASLTRRLKILLNLPRSVPLVWHLVRDNRVALWKKLLFVGGPIAYFLFPVDFISDFIPFLGQLDDLTVLLFMLDRFIASCPQHIVRDYWANSGK